jgi:3-hydroxyisobutyrate dehydrogenase-like beta-hydroxyacid dehydrogenase
MPQLAFIGLGNIGRAMTKNLVEKGKLSKPLILYNRTASRAQAHSESLSSNKTSVASTIADAVGPSDIIFSCLGDDKAVRAVIDEALQGNVQGKLFVECSTIEPALANELAKAVEAKGAGWISMPIFGAPPAASAGQLVTVPAGKAELLEKIKPYLTGVVGRTSIEFPDEEPGKALLLKITGNSIIMMMV